MLTSLEITDNRISGNLGNKLFLLAAIYQLADEKEEEVIVPHWQYENYFPNVKTTEKDKIWIDSHYLEPHFHYKKIEIQGRNQINIKEKIERINSIPQLFLFLKNIFRILLTKKCNANIQGYFQSEKFFNSSYSLIRNQFKLSKVTQKIVDGKWNKLISGWENESIVAVQIRRGKDYDNDYHGILSMSYYEKAFSQMDGKRFLVFSDDIEWCKNNIKYDNVRFVDNTDPVVDMFLGAKCDHAIMANSSFSWWTAWFICNPNKIVIAPKNWFGIEGMKVNDTKDLYGSDWNIL